MEFFNITIINLSLITAGLFFFFSLIQWVYKDKMPLNYFLSVLFFAVGYQYLAYWFYSGTNHFFLFTLMNTDLSFIFLIGPCLYFYFTCITGFQIPTIKKIIIHVIPFLVSLVIILLINIFPFDFLNWKVDSRFFFLDSTVNVYISILNILSGLSIFIYLVQTLRKLYFFFPEKNKSREMKFLLAILMISLLFSIVLNVANIFGSILVLVSHLAFSIIPLIFIFFSFRYPEFSMKIIKKSGQNYHEYGISGRYNDSDIVKRLHEIMKTKKLYIAEDLSLKTLSSALLISMHELSYIINKNFNQNFSTYINHYRINEAKILLKNNINMNIIDIAYECGFKSKSAFYQNFLKITGITPGEFIKKES